MAPPTFGETSGKGFTTHRRSDRSDKSQETELLEPRRLLWRCCRLATRVLGRGGAAEGEKETGKGRGENDNGGEKKGVGNSGKGKGKRERRGENMKNRKRGKGKEEKE